MGTNASRTNSQGSAASLTSRTPDGFARVMIQSGILNPHLLSLLARVRHTNTLVIADSMFPHWPAVPEVDLSLVYGIPTVPEVVRAILQHWKPGVCWIATEFADHNPPEVQREFEEAFGSSRLVRVPHLQLKARVPGSIGLIRTGERRIYTNVVMESA